MYMEKENTDHNQKPMHGNKETHTAATPHEGRTEKEHDSRTTPASSKK
jgi:hypothetical protein